jgi:ATP-dependent Zn protease
MTSPSSQDNTSDIELEKILKNHHQFADMAWSEVRDKVHTIAEYQQAYKAITKYAVEEIKALTAQKRSSENE